MVDKTNQIGYWIQEKGHLSIETHGAVPSISVNTLVEYINLDLGFEHSQARVLSRAINLDGSIDRALSLDLDLNLNLARTLSLNRHLADSIALNRAIVRARSLDLPLAFARSHSRIRALTHALARAFDRPREVGFDLELDLSLALTLDNTRVRSINQMLDQTLQRSKLRGILFLIGVLIWEIWQMRAKKAFLLQKNSTNWKDTQTQLKKLAEDYFDAFVNLCILEERIKGNLPASKGIRIVRELIQ